MTAVTRRWSARSAPASPERLVGLESEVLAGATLWGAV